MRSRRINDKEAADSGHCRRFPRAAALAVLAVTELGSGAALAQESLPADRFVPGIYVGAEAGAMSFDNACDPTALSCDHTDTAAAAFVGYRLNSRFRLEAGARDFGEASAVYPRLTSTIGAVGEASGYDLSALLHLPLGPDWETYLRAGVFRWKAETASPEFAATESGWSPSAGAGFAWQFKPPWQLRLQYLYVADVGGPETGEANVEMFTAGILYSFGSPRAAPAPAPTAAAPPAAAAAAAAAVAVSARAGE